MKRTSVLLLSAGLIALFAVPANAAEQPHGRIRASQTKYCIFRVPFDSSVDFAPMKIICDPDGDYVKIFYDSYLLGYANTSIVMTAPGGDLMYAKPLYADNRAKQ